MYTFGTVYIYIYYIYIAFCHTQWLLRLLRNPPHVCLVLHPSTTASAPNSGALSRPILPSIKALTNDVDMFSCKRSTTSVSHCISRVAKFWNPQILLTKMMDLEGVHHHKILSTHPKTTNALTCLLGHTQACSRKKGGESNPRQPEAA